MSQLSFSIDRVKMLKLILANFLFLLGAVNIDCADNNSKIVCYYDSRAFAKEGKIN